VMLCGLLIQVTLLMYIAEVFVENGFDHYCHMLVLFLLMLEKLFGENDEDKIVLVVGIFGMVFHLSRHNDNLLDYLNVDHPVINLTVVDEMDEIRMNLVLNYLMYNTVLNQV
jgi:hypothetical protein